MFTNAKLGDRFVTRDGRIMVFHHSEDDGVILVDKQYWDDDNLGILIINTHFVDFNGHWHRRDDIDTNNDIIGRYEESPWHSTKELPDGHCFVFLMKWSEEGPKYVHAYFDNKDNKLVTCDGEKIELNLFDLWMQVPKFPKN